MIVKHLALPANFVGGRHYHPGPVFVYVLEGELTVVLDGETKTFGAGELYAEDVDATMTGKNLSGTDDLEILVFQNGEAGKPTMIKVDVGHRTVTTMSSKISVTLAPWTNV